jgi:phosphate transport system permease protein
MSSQAPTLPANADVQARNDRLADAVFRGLVILAALVVVAALTGAALTMLYGGRDALQTFGWSFITSDDWDPGNLVFGALAPIFGTIVTSLIALLLAVPVSFGIALFLTEVAPAWLRTPLAMTIELLAGIPSIIYGMWGLFVLVPMLGEHAYPWINDHLGALPVIGRWFQGPPIGLGLLTAGIVLAVMIIPFISSVMREVFLTVPTRLKESAYALGSTTWEVAWDIVLPYTRSAVIGGIFLGLGRAMGETMAVTFVLGNTNAIGSLLEPSTSIASTIASEFGEASADMHRSALLALGFLLFVVTFVVLAIAKLMLLSLKRREGK